MFRARIAVLATLPNLAAGEFKPGTLASLVKIQNTKTEALREAGGKGATGPKKDERYVISL